MTWFLEYSSRSGVYEFCPYGPGGLWSSLCLLFPGNGQGRVQSGHQPDAAVGAIGALHVGVDKGDGHDWYLVVVSLGGNDDFIGLLVAFYGDKIRR